MQRTFKNFFTCCSYSTRNKTWDGLIFFFFNDTATTEIYTLSLHDALPICAPPGSSTSSTRKVHHGLWYTYSLASVRQLSSCMLGSINAMRTGIGPPPIAHSNTSNNKTLKC